MSDHATREELDDLFEHAPCGYVVISPNAHIVRANQTLATWLGVQTSALAGTPLHDMLTFGGRIAYETHLAPMLRLQGSVGELALDLRRPDGSTVPVIANASEMRDAAGRHIHTRLTLFKAVERRQYERGLLDARTKAESAVNLGIETAALREQFIAVLGHDLRNPLGAIDAGVRLLSKNENLGERGRHIAAEMSASIARADALVANLMDFARGRLGDGLTLDRNADAPLTPVLQQVVGEIRAIAPDRDVRAVFEIEEPLDCDRDRIAQLASNLLANAVAHGTPGIPIDFEARTDVTHFTLTVTNGGEPIPDEARARLFQPFFRGGVRRSQQGLGLGLFIVNEIAKAHHGSMAMTSTHDRTAFIFSMPLREV